MPAVAERKRRPTPTKRKTGPRPLPPEEKKRSVFSLRATDPYWRWMKDLLHHQRVRRAAEDLSEIVDEALRRYARQEGFDEEAPPR